MSAKKPPGSRADRRIAAFNSFSLAVRLMPNPLHGVPVKDMIATDNRHIEIERLRNEQPVKWVLVMQRQLAAPDHLPD
jgi:hypothetical protein